MGYVYLVLCSLQSRIEITWTKPLWVIIQLRKLALNSKFLIPALEPVGGRAVGGGAVGGGGFAWALGRDLSWALLWPVNCVTLIKESCLIPAYSPLLLPSVPHKLEWQLPSHGPYLEFYDLVSPFHLFLECGSQSHRNSWLWVNKSSYIWNKTKQNRNLRTMLFFNVLK